MVSYQYGAWGKVLLTTGELKWSVGVANPFRYRGYYYDKESGLYYLRSRYYDPVVGRFISADTSSVLTASPMSLTDKNLFSYCDNNPVMRRDETGKFWIGIVKAISAVAAQYIGDVVSNVVSGKTGVDIFKPSSSVGEYIAAGVTALIPGSGIGSNILRNTVTEGILCVEKKIKGESISIIGSAKNIALNTAVDYAFDTIADSTAKKIESKNPKNYSSFAGEQRKINPDITKQAIYNNMRKTIMRNKRIVQGINASFSAIRYMIPV